MVIKRLILRNCLTETRYWLIWVSKWQCSNGCQTSFVPEMQCMHGLSHRSSAGAYTNCLQSIYPGKDLWAACRCRSSGRESSHTVAHYSQSKLHISLYKFQIKSSLTERLSMGIVPAPRIFKVVVSYPPTLSEKWLTVTCHRLAPWTLMSLNWNGTIWCSEVFHENSFTLINLNGESC